MLKTTPAVFAVGKNYQIMVPVTEQSLFYVKVGDETYYDESNGIMRSLELVHRVTVPQEALDAAGEYTVIERKVIERKPYFPLIGDEVPTTFRFYPVPKKNARAYHIADAHNRNIGPAAAAALYGEVDFLILNGDIPDHSGSPENFTTIYRIADSVTHGEKPVVFARGNHDLRGLYAEKFADYTPQENGNTYYTFRLGSIWGIVLDGGEDKDDGSDEYYHTVACHPFRKRQTSFIRDVINNAENEYEADGVETRLVVSHNPFTYQLEAPFNIEAELYSEWARLLKENIKPDLMICGHLHRLDLFEVGGENDHLGQPCPVLIGAEPDEAYSGCGIAFGEDLIKYTFTSSEEKVYETKKIDLKK